MLPRNPSMVRYFALPGVLRPLSASRFNLIVRLGGFACGFSELMFIVRSQGDRLPGITSTSTHLCPEAQSLEPESRG
jgi:hypothetical protein